MASGQGHWVDIPHLVSRVAARNSGLLFDITTQTRTQQQDTGKLLKPAGTFMMSELRGKKEAKKKKKKEQATCTVPL